MKELFAGAVIGLLIGAFIGVKMGESQMRYDAVENGCAHYTITNNLNGRTEFRWSKP